MVEGIERILTSKIIFTFFLGIVISYLTASLIGSQRKGKWFKQHRQTSFFSRRGILGKGCHFGYPCTWQGMVVMILMYSIIFLTGYEIIFPL